MDLKSLKFETSTDIRIIHPTTGQDLDIVITVASADSDVFRNAELRRTQNRLNKVQRGARRALTAEANEADSLDILISCTLGWKGVELEGVPLPFTPDNVRSVYQEFPWLRQQVDEAIVDRSNFIRG